MNNIKDSLSRNSFFPNSKNAEQINRRVFKKGLLNRNDSERKNELEKYSQKDVKVKISDAIKDFARMKKVVDASPELENSDRIAMIKEKIKNGTYHVDPEKIADGILNYEL